MVIKQLTYSNRKMSEHGFPTYTKPVIHDDRKTHGGGYLVVNIFPETVSARTGRVAVLSHRSGLWRGSQLQLLRFRQTAADLTRMLPVLVRFENR